MVKSRKVSGHVADLDKTFQCLRVKGIKLNLEKCIFKVPRGMLLGFIVSKRGIEGQRVMGCLASLSRFISHLGEKGLPLYRLLKKSKHFSWTTEAQEALDKLKVLLTNPPILVPPAAGEPLLLYVVATDQVASAAIVVERKEEGHALSV